jgi:hypothetical protein
MKPRNIAWVGLFILFVFGAPAILRAGSKSLMVYYMPWYASKAHSGNWGWHWTMDHFNPEVVTATGERQIASWYYPMIGPYDSTDPAVLEYHVALMKLAGIDGVIVDWYGIDNFRDYGANNQAMAALFQFTRKAGLKFSVSYEDQTMQHMVEGRYLAADQAVVHAQQAMLYLQTNYFSDASFLRWQNQPVLLNFGPQYFKAGSDWQTIFSVLDPVHRPAFFTEDNYLPASTGAFSWPPMWLSHTPGTGGVLSDAALKGYLASFDQKAGAWPAFISSAFPRFHDIYQKAGVRDYWGYLGDRNGNTLRETLSRAMTNSSTIVQIVTWNDFGEGTVVEPTREYGYRDLGIIQDFRRQYLDTNFPCHTNDLALATRLFNLRRQSTTNAVMSADLDHVFTNIVAGDLTTANLQLTRVESKLTNEFKGHKSEPAE